MHQELARFRARLNEDAALRERLRRGESPIDLAHELGFQLTQHDLDAAMHDGQVELTEFELELVAGGLSKGGWGEPATKYQKAAEAGHEAETTQT
jgi:predicted ribosomally synthesized peptide with nif11-like leader